MVLWLVDDGWFKTIGWTSIEICNWQCWIDDFVVSSFEFPNFCFDILTSKNGGRITSVDTWDKEAPSIPTLLEWFFISPFVQVIEDACLRVKWIIRTSAPCHIWWSIRSSLFQLPPIIKFFWRKFPVFLPLFSSLKFRVWTTRIQNVYGLWSLTYESNG